MPVIASLPPLELKRILEAHGYHVQEEYEDQHNWLMIKDMEAAPLILPKEPGEDGCTSLEVQEAILAEAHIDHYTFFALRAMLAKDLVN